jgi:putative transcriptional regulator
MASKSLIKGGQILLSEPFMMDPHFKRSVIFLCEHDKEGSLGFILNKGIDVRLNELLPEFPIFDAEVFYGGPVQTDTLNYIHNVGHLFDDSYPIGKGIWMGGDFLKLQALVENQLIEPHNIRFFVGYSGWSGGQLEEELEDGSWVTAPLDLNYVFNSKPDKLWSKIMYNKGDLFEIISGMPDFISLN